MGKRKFSDEQIQFVKDNYPNLGAAICAEHLGLSPAQIRNIAKHRGIKVLQNIREKLCLGRKSDLTRNVPIKQFIEVNSPEISYILGILWAECWLEKPYKTHMCMVKEDFFDIEYLFDSTGKWNKQHRERENKKPSITVSAFSKELYIFFKELGMYPYSTESASKLIEIIPEKFRHLWWAGYFDGDGCIFAPQKQLSFSSSFGQDWEFFDSLCSKLDINYSLTRKKSNNGNCSVCRITGTERIKKFGNFIYQDGCIGLKRKFISFNKICNLYRFKIILPDGKTVKVFDLASWARKNNKNSQSLYYNARSGKKIDGIQVYKIT